MKDHYRNKIVDREPKAAELTRRGDRPGWIDRRFAKRLFSLLLVISLLSNTLGFVADDLMPVQGRQASAEILEIDTGVGGMASNDISDGLDLEDSLEDLTNDGLDQIGDLSLSQGLVSNGQGSEKTYVYHMQGETRLLLSDLVQKLNLPVRDMQFVGNVILMSNEQDPALDMSLFVQIVALDKDFLFCLKPLFRDVRLTVYTTDGTFILRLVNDMTLKPEDVTLAAQTLAQNPTPFDAVFSYDFARQPARIRLSRLLQRVGLPIKLKSIAEVGVVEHIGLEGQVLAIEKAKNDYVLTARHPFNEIELAVFTDTASYSIALLNGRAVGGDEGEEPLDFPTDISASGVSVSDSPDLPDDAIQDPSALELLDMPELDQGALIDAEPEIEQAEAPVVEPEVEQAEEPVAEPEVEQTEAPVAEPEVEQTEAPVAEPEIEQAEAPVAEPEVEQAEAPVAEPEVEQTEAPVAEPEIEQAEAPVAEPEIEQAEAPVVEPKNEQVEESITDPEIEQVEESITEPEIEQVEAPITEPEIEQVEAPITESEIEQEEVPITEPEIEQVEAPVTEPEIEQAEEPVTEPEIEQVEVPVTEPEIEQVEVPVTEPEIEQAEEPVTEPEIEQEEEPVTEPEIEQAEAPVAEPEVEQAEETEAEPEVGQAEESEAESEAGQSEESEAETEESEAESEESEAETEESEAESEAGQAEESEAETEESEAETEESEAETEAGQSEESQAESAEVEAPSEATGDVTADESANEGDMSVEAESVDEALNETQPESEEAPAVAWPAASFTARASGVNVSVTAEEGAFPEGTTMVVRRVWDADALSDIRQSVADDFVKVRRVQLVDIAFYDADGNEIEPRIPVSVVISVSEINEDQNAVVVHMDDEGQTEVVTQSDASSEDGRTNVSVELPAGETGDGQTEIGDGQTEIGFEADGFSLYAVVVTETISTHYIDASGNTWNVEVSYGPEAGIPSGATLSVSELKGAEADNYAARAAEALNVASGQMAYAKALDIAILVDGEEKTPTTPVSVSIKLLDAPEVDENTNVNVLHFGEEVESVSCALNGENVEFEADGFSVYVVTYTVDFHWGDYTYSIAGESEIRLSELFEKLGVNEITLADIENVTFSNPDLVGVEKLDSDWLLKSLAPFQTEEALVLALRNGQSVEIRVTDASDSGSWDNGTAGSGTWEIDEKGVLTISGTGKMVDYGGVNSTDWYKYLNKNSGSSLFATKLVFENGITIIGKNSFTRGFYVEEINAKNCVSLTTIGESAFKQSSYTQGSPNNPAMPERIDFSGCSSLNKINANAFTSCQGILYLDISGTQLTRDHLSNNTAGFGASKASTQTLIANNCLGITGSFDMSGYTALTTLELSGCTKLTELKVPTNNLTTLNISGSGIKKITNIDSCNKLTSLDVSDCASLTELKAPTNITSLDVSGSGVTSLDLSKCTALTSLDVSDCASLTTLKVPSSVTTLDVSGSGLTNLDISGCTGLTSLAVPNGVKKLNVSGSGVTSLDVSNCTDLNELDASNCSGLTSLAVPGSVTTLNVSGSGLTSLTVPDGVTTLNVSGSSLTSLDLSAGAALTKLDASNCAGLTSLNLTACKALTNNNLTLSNSVTELNIAGTTLSPAIDSLKSSLETLTMSPSNKKNVDLSAFTALHTIYFGGTWEEWYEMDILVSVDTVIIPSEAEKISLTITAENLTKVYDGNGTVIIDPDGDAYTAAGLLEGHSIASLTLASEQAQVGTYNNLTASDIKIVDDTDRNVTSRYDITITGTLTINPAPVTVTAIDASKMRDDDDPEFEAEVEGLVGDDTIAYTVSRTDAGTEEGKKVGPHDITPTGDTEQGNYTVTYVPGTLTILVPVTVTADTKSKTYGDADNLTATVTGLEETDSITIAYNLTRVKDEDVGVYTVTPSGEAVQDDYYVITYLPGTLTIEPKSVTVKADNLSKTYGNADPVLTATVTGLVGSDQVTYTLSRVDGEQVGEYAITPAAEATQGNYTVAVEEGTFSINKKPVIITAGSATKSHDGEALTNDSYTSTSLAKGDSIVSVTVTGSQTVAGSIDNVPSAAKIVNADGADATDNYHITYQNGVLLVLGEDTRSVIITAGSDVKSYDGTALMVDTCTPVGLAEGDRIESVTVTGSQTEVGASANVPSAAKIVNDNGDDVTSEYAISYANGTLEVTQREMTITADSDSKIYDGTALTKESYTVEGLLEGDSIDTVTVTGSQTVVGSADNVPSHARIFNAQGEDVTEQYDISYVNGTLEVMQKQLYITASDAEKQYDKTPLTKDSYSIDPELAEGDRIESILIVGTQTAIGSSDNEASNARIVNAQGDDVTSSYDIEYVKGTLEVIPKNVFVAADNKTKVYGEKDPELTARIIGLLEGDEESLISYAISRDEGEAVGTHTIRPCSKETESSEDELQGYYNVIFRTGTLTITPASVTIEADDKDKVTGADEPVFTATVTGLKNGDDQYEWEKTEKAGGGLVYALKDNNGNTLLTYTLTRPDNVETNPDREKSGEHDIVAAGDEEQGNYIVEYENGILTINKLTITFKNIDGESTLRTARLELNQPIGEVDDLAGVTKTGCDFKGWYYQGTETDAVKVEPETGFTKNTDLYPHFEVTVSFVADGATNPDDVVLDEGAAIGTLPEVSKDGYRFDGWYREPDFSGSAVTETDTFNVHTTLYAKFVDQVTVDFMVEKIEASSSTTEAIGEPKQIDKGASLGEGDYPTLTVPDGYAFRGWFVGDTQIDAEGVIYPINVNTTVTAHVVKQTTVTYRADQGDGTFTDYYTDAGDVNRTVIFPPAPRFPLEDAQPEAADFKGWYDETQTPAVEIDDNFTVAEDMTLTAHYTVTVNFRVKDADYTSITPETQVVIDKGATLGDKLPNDPAMTGYAFKGWFIEGTDGKPGATQVTSDTPAINAHTNVVAKFVRQVTIIFDTNGTRYEYTVDEGNTVALIENPILPNARFDGWFTESEGGTRVSNVEGITDSEGHLIDLNGNPLPEGQDPVRELLAMEDKILYARFINQVTVEFIVVNPETTSGSTGYPSLNSEGKFTIDKGDGIEAAFYDHVPLVSGYYFLGWYNIKQVRDSTVGYDYNTDFKRNGYFVMPNSVENGKVYELDNTRPAYIRDETTEYPTFDADTVLVAKFAKEVTITFRYEDEGGTSEVTVKDRCLAGKKLSDYYLPLEDPGADPSAYKEGYRIEWYRGSEKVDPEYVIVEADDNAVFDARYIQQVKATFTDENGNPIDDVDGNVIQPVTRDINTALGALPEVAPTIGSDDQECQFMGWFDETGKKYTADTILTADVTLKAIYGYQVTFHVDGDTWEFVRLVAPGTALGWLPSAPFREGYRFRNWTLHDAVVDGEHTVNQNETIIGHYDGVSIYTITVNYVIGSETKDTKILTVDKSTVSETNPVTVSSPTSFNQADGTYYPVMTAIQIVPDDTTGLGILDKHGDVTVVPDTTDTTKITITVPYKKADARYTVQYMLKNLIGSGYSQIESVPLQGVVGARVTPEVKEYDYAEFESLQTGVIQHPTGDVFKVYYTRKYFTLRYDTVGGKLVDSVTALYGTVINPLPTPEREGYTFDGWYKNKTGDTYTDNVTAPYTLTGDATLFAKWKANTVNYTIAYLFEKYNDAGTESSYAYDSSRTGSGTVGTTVYANANVIPSITRTGYEKDNTRNASSSVVIAADGSSVLYVYYKLKEYTFYFRPGAFGNYGNVTATMYGDRKTGNNNFAYTMSVKLGQNIASLWPTAVTDASFYYYGYYYPSFYGWQHPTNSTTYVTKRLIVTADMLPSSGSTITYTASWLLNTEEYTVNYWLQNADNDGYTKSSEYSQTIQSQTGGISLGAKDIAGYTYKSEKDDHKYKGSGNKRYIYEYNFYYDRDTFQIDYYYGSIKLNTIDNIKFDANINKAPYVWTPTADQCGVDSDYIWVGWFSDSGLMTPYTFGKMPSSNVPLYAKWNIPSYTINFHLNYDGATPEPYLQRTVEKYKMATYGMSQAEIDALNNPTPAPAHFTFLDWYTAPEGGTIFDPAGKVITENTDVYAHWKPKGVSYTVHYLRADNPSIHVLPDKTVMGNLVVGQEITEFAPYVTGYNLSTDDPDVTMVADQGSITIILDYEGNEITFYYGKKPDNIKYSVYYLLWEAHDQPISEQIGNVNYRVAEPKTDVEISGNYTSVTEKAAAPTVEAYLAYRPTKTTDTLALGTDAEKNILVFYYTQGAHVTVSWLDMEGDAVRTDVETETFLDVGETYTLDTVLNGYTLDHVEKNGEATEERSFMAVSDTEEINIKVYYKKNLMILAHSANKPYDGTPLTLNSVPGNVTADGLKDGHTITGITISGSQTSVGVSESMPSDAVISGLRYGLTAEQFYEITYLSGALTVMKINIIISVEPDRWTGNVYDGTYKPTGFTNGGKNIADYIIINNQAYSEAYVQQIWENLKVQLLDNGRGYEVVPDAILDIDGTKTEGLQILYKRDAGDYYEESGIFNTAVAAAIAALPEEARTNYNLIVYARECRLEISPAQLRIETVGAEKPYDGTPLTTADKPNAGMTVKVNEAVITPVGQDYTLAEGDTVTIEVTGRQIHPGTSHNIFEITWGDVNSENYALSEDLGTLKVTARPLLIEAQDAYKAFGATNDPDFAVKVYPASYVQDTDEYGNPRVDDNGDPVYKALLDDNGDPVLDEDGNQVLQMERDGEEIPATLTHWGGDDYTLQLNDPARGYIDNLSIKITRESGVLPGTYVITPDWADDAVKYYNANYVNGKLTIGIARVYDDNGATWTYHQWLVNDEYNPATDDPSAQGAFDRAKALGGDVIVETLNSNDTFERYDIADRYALDQPVELGVGDQLDALTLRTTTGAAFTSVISRVNHQDSLFENTCEFTLENIILDGGSYTISADGGLVYVQTGGTLTLNDGARLQHSATNGKGGAVYVDGALTVNSGATITGNTGNAVFVNDDGRMTMTGGSITGNYNTTGSAVEIGGAGASLTFSGDAVVYDNLTNEAQQNVCLDYDGNGIINTAGLTSGAKIGVYVEDTAPGEEAGKLFADRGGVLDCFGTHLNGANLDAFVNDRNGLKGAARSSYEIIWVKPITVEVRYMRNLLDYATMPTRAASVYMMTPSKYRVVTDIEYIPSLGEESKLIYDPAGFTIEQIERDIYDNFGGSAWPAPATSTMVFWRGYAENEEEFGAHLKALTTYPADETANAGLWSFDKNSDADATVPAGTDKLVLYYTEPAYITISNDSSLALTNNDMTVMLPGYTGGDMNSYSDPQSEDPAVISVFDHAFVTKIGDEEQSKPYSTATKESLSLADGSSVTLMIPGAVGAMYWFDGEFKDAIDDVTVVSVDRIGGTPASDEKLIKLDTVNREKNYPSTAEPALPMSQGDAYSHRLYGGLTQATTLHFGEAYICKITDEAGNLLRVNGKIQAFKSLEEGFEHYKTNTSYDGGASPAYIKMLVDDYELKLKDKLSRLGGDYATMTQIVAPAGKPVILTTAATTDEELPGPYEAGKSATRCVIRRGTCTTSMFSVPGNASFGTENIVLDGGAVFENGVYSSGEIAQNGGIVNVDASGTLTVSQGTLMCNSAVTSTDNNAKVGGAIHAAEKSTLNIAGTASNRVEFTNCQANGGGAIYNPGKNGFAGTTSIQYCTFNYCQAKGTLDKDSAGYCGGGAVRSMVNSLTLRYCEFNNCSAVQQGGAVYHLKDGVDGTVFKAEYCNFTSCKVFDPAGKVQAASGGAESQARSVTVDQCTFTDCSSSKNAGAFNVYNTKSTINVKDTTFVRCHANGKGTGDYGNGGALRTTGSKTTVENCSFQDCEANNRGGAIHCKTNTTIKGSTTIQNSKANVYGGGAIYLENGTLTVEAVTIMNCQAPDGGAIYQGGGTCNFKGGTITGCVSTKNGNNNGRGGGLYMGGGTFNMSGGTITSCNAYSNGGGVCLNATGAIFNLNGGTITSCNSLASGGGVYMGSGTFAFTNGQINKCSAKTGGGVYIYGSGTVTINKNGEAITKCKAANVTADSATGAFTVADAHDSDNKGGGLYQNGGSLTITKAIISGCSAYDGGGIYLGGNSNTALNIGEDGKTTGGKVRKCTASNNGGGIYQNAGKLSLHSGTSIEENKEAQNGGGIYLNDGTLDVYSGTTIQKNTATNGGGIYQGGGTQTIHGGNIKSNNAEGNGGGIYLGGGSFTLLGGNVGGLDNNDNPVGGNTARHGGGLYVGNGTSSKPTEASIKGGKLAGNHATEVAGGGGIAIGGEHVRLYFEGSIQVWGNTMEPSPDHPLQTTCDVCLNVDSNEIIRTTSVGLNEESHIGVYVPDKKVGSNDLFEDLHGTTGLPFGTFENSKNGDSYLNRFINNRSGTQGYEYYYGVRWPESRDPQHRIRWVSYICEITDPNGNLLFTNNKATSPALYQFLDKQGAFEDLRNNKHFYNEDKTQYTGTEYHVRMLILDYDLEWNQPVKVPAKGTIKLMMADKDDKNMPTAVSKAYDRKNGIVTIGRGTCTTSMFETEPGSNFILESVTLDGGAAYNGGVWTGECHADGALINASGNVTLNNKVLLRNSYTTKSGNTGGNGGAIAYRGPGTLTMKSGAVIDHSKAQNGAALYVDASNATETSPVNLVMEEGARIQNCEGTNGLIYVKNGVVNLNSAFDNKKDEADTAYNVSGCTSSFGGLAYVAGGALNVNHSVKDFTATNGGAVYVNGGTITVDVNGTIESCTATTNGGAVYVNGDTSTVNVKGKIESCAATANGGAVYVNGGAVYVNGATSTVNVIGTIESCTATANGGAVYVKNSTLNLTPSAEAPNANPVIKNCSAVLGGAIFETGNTARVNLSVGEVSGNTATGSGGGALRIEENAQAVISGTVQVKDNVVTGENGDRWGGAVNIKKGKLEINGGTISGNKVETTGIPGYGGAISLGADCSLIMTDGEIINNTVLATGGNAAGGAISVSGASADVQISGGTITGNTAKTDNMDAFGGAVYVASGTVTLKNGTKTENGNATDTHVTVTGNTATTDAEAKTAAGAGIYLAEGAKLNLEGDPNFGGTDLKGGNGEDRGDILGQSGNFLQVTLPANSKNGGKDYEKARQDIYIAGYARKDAASLTVTGGITSGNGTIWVWAEDDPHYKVDQQFANIEAGASVSDISLMAFRNARPDAVTENRSSGYLYGTEKDDDKVYWSFPIARVSNDGGNTWTYHDYLINDTDIAVRRGAFNYANTLSGEVIIETLVEEHERYALKEGFEFNATGITILTIRTVQDEGWNPTTTEGDKFTSTIERGYDGESMMTSSVPLTLEKIILDGNKDAYSADTNGGIVNVAAGKLTIAEGAILRNAIVTGDGTTTGLGGAVYVAANATAEMTGGEITGNEAVNGGAVYVKAGATMTLKNGKDASNNATHVTINGNTATTNGAGIYLEQDSILKLQGSPSFGGTGTADPSGANPSAAISGPAENDGVITNGNYLTTALSGQTNGQVNYTTARQDIFLVSAEDIADSIMLTGALDNVSPGSIWVWAQQEKHYKMLEQFAVFDSGLVSDGKIVFSAGDSEDDTKAKLEAIYLAFRNARIDRETGCGGEYLTGQEGDTIELIKWTGGFDFLFRKIDGDGNPIGKQTDGSDGATFTLYTSVKNAENKLVPTKKGTKDVAAENLETEPLGNAEWNVYTQSDNDATATSKKIEAANAVKVKVFTSAGAKPKDAEVYGEGLAVFEKIPPGNYFMVETGEPTGWKRMVDVYRVFVDGSGWISITAVETDASGKKVWPEATDPTQPKEDSTVEFVKDGNNKYTWSETVTGGADTISVYNIMNVSTKSRKVILKKVDGADYKPLDGAEFTVYYADKQTVVRVPKEFDASGNPTSFEPLNKLTSGAGGAFWIGKLPFGTYYLEETVAPVDSTTTPATNYPKPTKYFQFKVDENGVSKMVGTAWTPTNTLNADGPDISTP